MPSTPPAPLADLQARLGHTFANPALLAEALAHPSYTNEHPEAGPSNQRLEFLGDAVLQLVLTEALYALYPAEPEGPLSRRRSVLTNGRTLAGLASAIGLDAALRLGASEDSTGGRTRSSNLEDAFEALVGAIYLDAGLEKTRACLLAIYGPLETRLTTGLDLDNPKGRLQERVQPLHGNTALRYESTHSAGADHAKEYSSKVFLLDRLVGEGRGTSKKAAEEAAARAALEQMGD
jgi:ribonuclease-3